MEYRKFGDTIVARFDPGEEIVTQVRELMNKEQIQLAEISALGAVESLNVGAFVPAKKQYQGHTFTGVYEIVSLVGTINTMDGKPYLHLHMSAADESGHVVGGHLQSAVVSLTCEMVLRLIPGRVDRYLNPETGLNQFVFF